MNVSVNEPTVLGGNVIDGGATNYPTVTSGAIATSSTVAPRTGPGTSYTDNGYTVYQVSGSAAQMHAKTPHPNGRGSINSNHQVHWYNTTPVLSRNNRFWMSWGHGGYCALSDFQRDRLYWGPACVSNYGHEKGNRWGVTASDAQAYYYFRGNVAYRAEFSESEQRFVSSEYAQFSGFERCSWGNEGDFTSDGTHCLITGKKSGSDNTWILYCNAQLQVLEQLELASVPYFQGGDASLDTEGEFIRCAVGQAQGPFGSEGVFFISANQLSEGHWVEAVSDSRHNAFAEHPVHGKGVVQTHWSGLRFVPFNNPRNININENLLVLVNGQRSADGHVATPKFDLSKVFYSLYPSDCLYMHDLAQDHKTALICAAQSTDGNEGGSYLDEQQASPSMDGRFVTFSSNGNNADNEAYDFIVDLGAVDAVAPQWSASPATGVVFEDDTDPKTRVTFSRAGTYTLTLSHGEHSDSLTATITEDELCCDVDLEALEEKDSEHDAAIAAIEQENVAQDQRHNDAISELSSRLSQLTAQNAAQATTIQALQQKDAEHKAAIEAIQALHQAPAAASFEQYNLRYMSLVANGLGQEQSNYNFPGTKFVRDPRALADGLQGAFEYPSRRSYFCSEYIPVDARYDVLDLQITVAKKVGFENSRIHGFISCADRLRMNPPGFVGG